MFRCQVVLSVGIAMSVMACGCAPHGGGVSDGPVTDHEVCERLLTIDRFPHGLWGWPPEELLNLKTWLRDHPRDVARVARRACDEWMRPKVDRRSAGLPMLATCLWGLRAADPVEHDQLVVSLFRRVHTALSLVEPAYQRNVEGMRQALGPDGVAYLSCLLNHQIDLYAAAEAGQNAELVDMACEAVEWDATTNSVNYLMAMTDKRPDVRAFLIVKREDPKSRLYKSPVLRNL